MPDDRIDRRAAFGLLLPALLLLSACDSTTAPPADPLVITTTELPEGIVGDPYAESVNAEGGAGGFSWTLLGSLPPGLVLSVDDLPENEAIITGTPETPGSFEFQVRVESRDGQVDSAQLSIAIARPPEPVAITTPRLPPVMAAGIYRVQLKATGGEQAPNGEDAGTFEWEVVEGSLPAGLDLESDGQFSGTTETADTATFTVEVSSGGFTDRKTFSIAVVAENPDRYDITLFPVVGIPSGLEDNVREAVRRWESAITGDLGAVAISADFFSADDCAGFGELVNGTVMDDILILINIESIDGVGGAIAQAGPCAIRSGTDLPPVGILTLDRDDLENFSTEELTTDVIQHEIGHVLGFGALWNRFGLILGEGTDVPIYTGAEAVAEYQDATGATDSIPVEADGGQGTRDSHWDEETFGAELMTGFVQPPSEDNWLSRMTIASFADMNYVVDLSAADAGPLFGWMAEEARSVDHIGYDIVGVGPIVVIRPDGTRSHVIDPRAARP